RRESCQASIILTSDNIQLGQELSMKGPAMSSTEKASKRRRAGRIAVVAMVVEAAGLWLRTRRIGGNVVVRCRSGHLFTTIWIPGASVKALRLGWWRVQRCPVGRHLSLVAGGALVVEAERHLAHEIRVRELEPLVTFERLREPHHAALAADAADLDR